MAFYDGLFNAFGLREWCDASAGSAKKTMASLLAKTNPDAADEGPLFPFPSMDELYKACPSFPQSREFTAGVEEAFLNATEKNVFFDKCIIVKLFVNSRNTVIMPSQ